VHNLKQSNPDITHESLCDALAQEFKSVYSSDCEVEMLSSTKLKEIPSLNECYTKLKDWNWRYGTTPHFNHQLETRFDWGTMDVNINAKEGLITEVKIYSDSLFPNMIEDLSNSLVGVKYLEAPVSEALAGVEKKYAGTENEKHIRQFAEWLIPNL